MFQVRLQNPASLDFHLDGSKRRRTTRPGDGHRLVRIPGHVGHVPPADPLRPVRLDHHPGRPAGVHPPGRHHPIRLPERRLASEPDWRTLG